MPSVLRKQSSMEQQSLDTAMIRPSLFIWYATTLDIPNEQLDTALNSDLGAFGDVSENGSWSMTGTVLQWHDPDASEASL